MDQDGGWNEERLERVRSLIRKLYAVVDELNEEFIQEGRKFPLDGHMIGSLGEVVAAYVFDLQLLPTGAEGHDAKSKDGRLVQIKLTGGNRWVGLNSKPEHLIALQLRADKKLELVYNGPGEAVWEKCGKEQKNGQRKIGLRTLRELNTETTTKFPQVRDFPV